MSPISSVKDAAQFGTPQGEFPFTMSDFRHIAGFLREDIGITLTEAKAPLVYARLVKRLRSLGLESFRDYCVLVASPEGEAERKMMMTALTTNVTRFFREPHHFEHLRKEVCPDLADRAKRGRRVRLWSAGCSTGEEPYSMALTLLRLLPDAHTHDVRILASDVNTHVLEHAREGVYTEAAAGAVEPDTRDRWFMPTRTSSGIRAWEAGKKLKSLIAFRELNLIGPWPMRGPFDAVFCRNTVIYFEEDVQADIWARMADMVAPGGYLYIGHSERIVGTEAFEPVGLTVYRRRGDG